MEFVADEHGGGVGGFTSLGPQLQTHRPHHRQVQILLLLVLLLVVAEGVLLRGGPHSGSLLQRILGPRKQIRRSLMQIVRVGGAAGVLLLLLEGGAFVASQGLCRLCQ